MVVQVFTWFPIAIIFFQFLNWIVEIVWSRSTAVTTEKYESVMGSVITSVMMLLSIQVAGAMTSPSCGESEAIQDCCDEKAADRTPGEGHDLDTDTSSKTGTMEGIPSQNNKCRHQGGSQTQAEQGPRSCDWRDGTTKSTAECE